MRWLRAARLRSILVGQDHDQEHDERKQYEQRDLPRALWILPGHAAGVAVDDDLIARTSIQVRQEPHGDENVLERPARKHRPDCKVAIRVAWDLAGRHF